VQRLPSNLKATVAEQNHPRAIEGNDAFAVVAVGASAGGLEAFTQLLQSLPNDTGMAFVFIQHLDPTRHSMLSELLAKETDMPVVEAKNGTPVIDDQIAEHEGRRERKTRNRA
jgi:two-component system CheB/CheR fusion protein